ncbi:MAG: outer membrane beta-barrel protein [Bacteroidales bacterium]|nr:outer membrane beta-barrel protein [Bacteroidales bacterium]
MSGKINRDDLIRQKIRDFEKAPPPEIWMGIRNGISSGRRKMIPLYLKYAAGIILFLGSVSLLKYLIPAKESISPLTVTEEKAIISKEELKSLQSLSEPNKAELADAAESEGLSKEEVSNETIFTAKAKSSGEKQVSDLSFTGEPVIAVNIQNDEIFPEPFRGNVLADAGGSLPVQITPFNPEYPLIERSVSERVYSWDDLEPEEFHESHEPAVSVFSLGAMISPIFSYRDIAGVSASLTEYFNEAESGKFGYTGGLNFGIRAGKRFSFHSGLFYNRLGVSVNNILAVAEFKESWSDEIRFEPEASSIYLVSNSIGSIKGSASERAKYDYSSLSPASPASAVSTELNYLNSGGFYAPADNYVADEGSIDQFFHYFEIPLTLRYKLIDKKLDLGLLGGMSTNFLVGNQVVYNQNGNRNNIGRTSDIRTINYSGNVGLGLNYDLSEQFRFLFEPQFKYYLHSINQEGLIINRPYSIGLYTGFIYLF